MGDTLRREGAWPTVAVAVVIVADDAGSKGVLVASVVGVA